MRIVAENLSYYYGGKDKNLNVKALDGVSLTIEEGDFFGIIGKTGSGKSTFVQHLNGLIKVQKDSGKLYVGDFDLTDKNCDFKTLRSKIGMVFQYPEYQLFAETVKDDVAFGLKNFHSDLSEARTEELVKEALSAVGLNYSEIKDKSPFDLSGGQKRRVAIAGVIVSKPEVLVLDEPAAGLDPKGKEEFLRLLKNFHSTFAKTVVIVSHDMDLVAEYCNNVAVFKDGKITAAGTPEKIFSDYENIKDCGLGLPTTAIALKILNEHGIKIDCNLDSNSFVNALTEYFKGVKQ